jgi:hypothetical protein
VALIQLQIVYTMEEHVPCEPQYFLHSALKKVLISLLLLTRQMDYDRLINYIGYIRRLPYVKNSCSAAHMQIVLVVGHSWHHGFLWIRLRSRPTPD